MSFLAEAQKQPESQISGIIFLDKPSGWSSRRAVNEMVRIFTKPGQKKVKAGHGGTLDPLATGMLPILIGEATRYAELGLNAEKVYRVDFDLSYQTDTLDMEGEVTERFAGEIDESQLLAVIEEFRGEQQQYPPAYSAVRIQGKRAYALARQGENVEMPARTVTIADIRLLVFNFPVVKLEVRCSKGTYIRSLARDIGAALGMGGCVTELRRLSTGGWPEALMVTPETVAKEKEACLLPLEQWLRGLPRLDLAETEAKRFLQGQRIQLRDRQVQDGDTAEQPVAIFSNQKLLGTALLKAGMHCLVIHPVRILPSAQEMFL